MGNISNAAEILRVWHNGDFRVKDTNLRFSVPESCYAVVTADLQFYSLYWHEWLQESNAITEEPCSQFKCMNV